MLCWVKVVWNVAFVWEQPLTMIPIPLGHPTWQSWPDFHVFQITRGYHEIGNLHFFHEGIVT